MRRLVARRVGLKTGHLLEFPSVYEIRQRVCVWIVEVLRCLNLHWKGFELLRKGHETAAEMAESMLLV